MNWLEIGCPYCPTVMTVPAAASGRNLRCPECGKSYIVPEPKQSVAPYAAAPPLPTPPAAMEEVEFEELEPAAVDDVTAYTLAPAHDLPAVPPAPTRISKTLPSAPPPAPTPAQDPPPVSPAASSAAMRPAVRKSPATDAMQPELAHDSPLPELEILAPPVARKAQAPSKPAPHTDYAPHSAPPAANHNQPSPQPPHAPRPPLHPPAAGQDDGLSEEVRQRMLRNQRRAIVNLVAFVVGIVIMTVFAYVVIHFSRRA